MPSAVRPVSGRPPAEIREAIESFLRACREPALFEPGDPPIRVSGNNLSIEVRGGRLLLEAWDNDRNLARRVTGAAAARGGRLELAIERFGGRPGTLVLADLSRPAAGFELKVSRLTFQQQFHRFLTRRFPGWKLQDISTAPDLEHTLSATYPRAFLKRGGSGWAAIGLPPAGDPSGVLTSGLVWLDYLRGREHRNAIEGLCLFLPEGRHLATSLRLPYLNERAARFSVYVYSAVGVEELLDPADYGNIDTRLDHCLTPSCDRRFPNIPGATQVFLNNGWISYRVRGLEFARSGEGELRFGIDTKRKAAGSDFDEVEALARELARLRSPGAADRTNPLYLRAPELWLESQVRANLAEIDASLLAEPLYGQVPAMAGGERGVIDLLAVDRRGRLAVIELKATEDPGLPLQALDYWMRVKWHLDRGEFTPKGYFPGIALSTEAPRLLLIAPALAFHPTTEAVLRYLSPGIEVERCGVGIEWRKALKTMFRFRGAQGPV